jgi:hypothetical protein
MYDAPDSEDKGAFDSLAANRQVVRYSGGALAVIFLCRAAQGIVHHVAVRELTLFPGDLPGAATMSLLFIFLAAAFGFFFTVKGTAIAWDLFKDHRQRPSIPATVSLLCAWLLTSLYVVIFMSLLMPLPFQFQFSQKFLFF